MTYQNIALEDFTAGLVYKDDLSEFKSAIATMAENAQKDDSEEFQKNVIAQFLSTTFDYECNTRGKADLAIYDNNKPLVLFEVKSLSNKAEFVKSPKDLSSKALYESILYYLREFHAHKNNNIKHIILCTAHEFYIINAKAYHKLFANNADKATQKRIDTAYNNCDKKQGTDTSTGKFYDEIARILPDIDATLEFCYINLADILEKPRDLALFYALLSPNFLLQIPRYIDANTLNERFYKELLYILGLVQVEQNNKALILPSTTPNTLLYSIKRDFADKLPRENSQDSADIFDSHIFPLIMLWNNRILFLRLLESMLLSFRHIDKPFLDISILRDFGALNTLFFKVLAVKNRADIPPNLANIPYLNSSLFEKSALESQGFEIATLQSKPLKIAPDSILRRDKTLRERYIGKDEQLPLLEYLFAFLHAYDFTTTPSDVQNYAKTNHDKLINSAVLGLVFEKLNGYKEGSFYTPSFITRYMCESSIRKIVVEKFQERGFKAQSLIALRNEIDINKLNDANKIFLSIRICDPAVGSGHFLVSALNELIAIKSELGLLLDCEGRRLSDIDLVLENDELLIKDSQGKILDYHIPAHEGIEVHKIQKAIFYTKKELIENCLFGVDINPNSVEICKLRLWIELLKYSYYENIATKELQTLPNIDINIKCGNSLISRFDLHDSLKHIPNIAHRIKEYKQLVFDYKNADQAILKVHKSDIEAKITHIKKSFNLVLKDPKTKIALEKAIEKHIAHYGFYLLDNESILAGLNGGFRKLFDNEMSLNKKEQESALESYANIMKLRKKLDSALSGAEYKNAFEWRFEFPEVLSENGDFMGFDLIIGNPPYIDYREINENTIIQTKQYAVNQDSNRPNIFCYFVERGIEVISQNGFLTLINPITMLQADFAYGTRKILLEKGCIEYVADCSYIKVFDSASTYPALWLFRKNKKQDSIKVVLWQDDDFVYSHDIETYANNKKFSINLSKYNIDFKKVDCQTLDELCTLKWGTSQSGYGKKKILLSDFKKLNKSKQKNYKPIIQTADIKRYSIVWQKEYIPTEIYSQNIQEDFKKPKIVIARMTKNIQATFDNNGFYMGKATLIVDYKENPYYILGILNSKIADFWYKYYFGATHLASGYIRYDIPYLKQLPIPKLNTKNKKIADKIANLVDKILELKAKDLQSNTTTLESQIDKLVYQLYDLDSSEIKIIESN